ncbi:MAG: cytidine deaminase [Acidimicrobiia bacterium]|nr:cytidine deaminase [Acidimicrobiia bacterium]
MNITDPELVELARTAARNAYAPYSKFRVGSAVVTKDGRVFTGSNIENAAYPSSVCAEANAITTAAAEGARRIQTVAVACIDGASEADAYPCGNCRQIMNEFKVQKVIVTTGTGEIHQHTLAELLPHGFRLT